MAAANRLTIHDLVTGITGQQIPGLPGDMAGVEIRDAVIDSRLVRPGYLFVALRGEHQDGHDFIPQAIGAGAIAVLAERCPPGLPGTVLPAAAPPQVTLPLCLVVPDSLAALHQLAAHWRRRLNVRVLGITGSVGKTTSKEVVAGVLRQRFSTLKSEGNYNNEIGLPLTVLRLNAGHECVVLEMGMYAVGEIAHLASIALPQVGIVTNVGPSHLERLGSIERIAQAKAELPQALPPADQGGVAILNADDPRVLAMAGQTQARVLTYGLTPAADLWADEIESEGLEGIRFRLHYGIEAIHARMPLLGRHSVHTALCGAAAGLVEGLDWEEIVAGLHDQQAELRLVAVRGPGGAILLDDTYNASPSSSVAALNLLEELDVQGQAGRKIAVLGDMYELGAYEEEAHKLVGRRARDVVDLLLAVGNLGQTIGLEALRAGMPPENVHLLADNAEAIDRLRQVIDAGPGGDVILVKGSRGMRMEEIVIALQERGPS